MARKETIDAITNAVGDVVTLVHPDGVETLQLEKGSKLVEDLIEFVGWVIKAVE